MMVFSADHTQLQQFYISQVLKDFDCLCFQECTFFKEEIYMCKVNSKTVCFAWTYK